MPKSQTLAKLLNMITIQSRLIERMKNTEDISLEEIFGDDFMDDSNKKG